MYIVWKNGKNVRVLYVLDMLRWQQFCKKHTDICLVFLQNMHLTCEIETVDQHFVNCD